LNSDNPKLNLDIIQEIVLQFIINTYKPGGGSTLPERHIESKHPYDNNLDVDEAISIPGA
jgi:hypothetical protein